MRISLLKYDQLQMPPLMAKISDSDVERGSLRIIKFNQTQFLSGHSLEFKGIHKFPVGEERKKKCDQVHSTRAVAVANYPQEETMK
jgi:hypothetical protein